MRRLRLRAGVGTFPCERAAVEDSISIHGIGAHVPFQMADSAVAIGSSRATERNERVPRSSGPCNGLHGNGGKSGKGGSPSSDPLFQLFPPVPCIQLCCGVIERVLASPASAKVR